MNELEQKELEYKEYIKEHLKNVETSGHIIIKKFDDYLSSQEVFELLTRLKYHDISKYSEEEFEYYRNKFHPCKAEIIDYSAFNEAWKHHYENNDHHWNYWVDSNNIAKPMDKLALFELLCDWYAMGIKFGGTPKTYYESNKQKINLHPQTRQLLEALLERF